MIDKSRNVTATLIVKVSAEFYDEESDAETLRYCVEQDLEDAGINVIDVSVNTQEEYAELLKKLDGHDSNLLDKVAEKLKAEVNICKNCMIVDCDTEYFRPMCEKADKGYFAEEVCELVDKVIAEMKAGAQNGKQ